MFLNVGIIGILDQKFFDVGAILFVVEYLAASLASAIQMPVAFPGCDD